jgi:hypothetical protein
MIARHHVIGALLGIAVSAAIAPFWPSLLAGAAVWGAVVAAGEFGRNFWGGEQ